MQRADGTPKLQIDALNTALMGIQDCSLVKVCLAGLRCVKRTTNSNCIRLLLNAYYIAKTDALEVP